MLEIVTSSVQFLNTTDSEKGLNYEADFSRYNKMREMSRMCRGMPHESYRYIC